MTLRQYLNGCPYLQIATCLAQGPAASENVYRFRIRRPAARVEVQAGDDDGIYPQPL
jgi:hypothetical protein